MSVADLGGDVSCGLPKDCYQHTHSASCGTNDAEKYFTFAEAGDIGNDEERGVKECCGNGDWDGEQTQLPQHGDFCN